MHCLANNSCLTFQNRIGNAEPENKSIIQKTEDMKKLKSLKLDALKEVLSRDQMKKITGGYYCPDQRCSFSSQCCPTWHCCFLSGFCTSPGNPSC